MSLICLTMAFVLDLKGNDGSVYRAGSVVFAIIDLVFLGVTLGFLYG